MNTFDPGKKIKLATYASRCIENEILMYLRRNNKTRAEVSFDEPLNTDWDGNELLLSDVLGVESDVTRHIEEEVDRALLWAALDRLTGREKRIMELRFGLNRRPGEDAEGGGRHAGHFPILHLPAGKADPQEAASGRSSRMTVSRRARTGGAGTPGISRSSVAKGLMSSRFRVPVPAYSPCASPAGPLGKSRGDHGHPDLVLQRVVDDRAEDDVRLGVGGFGDDLGGLVDLEEARGWCRR